MKLIVLKILFRSRYVETVNNKYVRHKAIVLYVSHWPTHLGKCYCFRVWTNNAKP